MREKMIAVILGVLTGLIVYSFIGWVFTRKIASSVKYIVVLFLSIVLFIVVVILLK